MTAATTSREGRAHHNPRAPKLTPDRLQAIAAAIKEAPRLDLTALKVYLTGTGDISTSTVYAMVADGLLPRPVHIGKRRVVWVREDVDASLAARTAESRR